MECAKVLIRDERIYIKVQIMKVFFNIRLGHSAYSTVGVLYPIVYRNVSVYFGYSIYSGSIKYKAPDEIILRIISSRNKI